MAESTIVLIKISELDNPATSAKIAELLARGIVPVSLTTGKKSGSEDKTYGLYVSDLLASLSSLTAEFAAFKSQVLNGVDNIWFVDADDGSDDDNLGKAPADAFKTVGHAVGQFVSGIANVVVLLSPGVTEVGSVSLPDGTVLLSGAGGVAITGTVSGYLYLKARSVALNSTGLSAATVRAEAADVSYSGNAASFSSESSVLALGTAANVESSCSVLNLSSAGTLTDCSVRCSRAVLDAEVSVAGSLGLNAGSLVHSGSLAGKIVLPGTADSKFTLNIGKVYSPSAWTWLEVNSSSGITSTAAGFVGDAVNAYVTGGTADGTNDIRITYAGVESGDVLFDAVVGNASDLVAALADSSVRSVFEKGYIPLSGTVAVSGTKDIFGSGEVYFGDSSVGCVLSGDVRFHVPVRVDVAGSSATGISFTRLYATGAVTLDGSSSIYEYIENVSGTGLSQSLWESHVGTATYAMKGVACFDEDTLEVVDGLVKVRSQSLRAQDRRFVSGSFVYTDRKDFVGKHAPSENYGTAGLFLNTGSGAVTVADRVSYVTMTFHAKTVLSDVVSLHWFVNSLEIGYFEDDTFSSFVVLKTFKNEHCDDSDTVCDTFAYSIDCSKLSARYLALRFTFDVDGITGATPATSYVVSLIQSGLLLSTDSAVSSVRTDDSMTGIGTEADPLSVASTVVLLAAQSLTATQISQVKENLDIPEHVYTPKGDATVSEVNALGTGAGIGWVYNMSDSGTVTIGGTYDSGSGTWSGLEVSSGDNVVWINSGTDESPLYHWDRLSSDFAPVYHASAETKYGVGSASLYGHVKLYPTASGTNTDGAPTQNAVRALVSDDSTWYLDTVNGDDSNTGKSRFFPMKTGDAVVVAAKEEGRSSDSLVIMSNSYSVVFNAGNWSSVSLPFFDIRCESNFTFVTWNAVTFPAGVYEISGGLHTFSGCTFGASQKIEADRITFSGGTCGGNTDVVASDQVHVAGTVFSGSTRITANSLQVTSYMGVHGICSIDVGPFTGTGTLGTSTATAVFLDLKCSVFSFEGYIDYPSQTKDSNICLVASTLRRTATTKLMYLGAQTGVTVNAEAVVDELGEITLYEISDSSGTVSVGLVELLSGVAPLNHASSETTYGIGTDSLYGHVKLYNSVSGTNTDGSPTQASVKEALDSKQDVTVDTSVTLGSAVKQSVEILPNSPYLLSEVPSTATSLFLILQEGDTSVSREWFIDFSTGSTMNVASFGVYGPGSSVAAVDDDLSSKLIRFTAAQLNHIYSNASDQTIVTATESISYVQSTSTLTVGSETLVLDGAATDSVYFLLNSSFGTVTALGSLEYDYPYALDDVLWNSELTMSASTHYQIDVFNGVAVGIGVAI